MSEDGEGTLLWLDDVRRPPSGDWAWARSVEAAIEILAKGTVIEASFDNDLHPFERDGLEVLVWMEENGVWPERVRVHTSNRFASTKMCNLLEKNGYRPIPGQPRSFIKRPKISPAEFAKKSFKYSPKAMEKLR